MTGWQPPNPVRVIWLIAAISVRRRLNKIAGNLGAAFRRKKPREVAPRTGTARKGRGGSLLLAFLGVFFLFQAYVISAGFISRLNNALEDRYNSALAVSSDTYKGINVAIDGLRTAQKWPAGSNERFSGQREYRDYLKKLFQFESKRGMDSEEEEAARVVEFQRVFDEKGLAGFKERRTGRDSPFELAQWRGTEQQPLMIQGLGIVFAFLSCTLFLLTVGQWSQDFGKVEWSMEWLFTFPIPARVLFLAKVFEIVLANPVNWFVLFPFSTVVFWSAGFGWWGIPTGLAVAAYISILLGALHVFIETWMRKRIRPAALKNLQALFTLTGTIGFFAVMWMSTQPTAIPYLEKAMEFLPRELSWFPASLPVLLCNGAAECLLPLAAMLGVIVIFPYCGVRLAESLVRNGLTTAGGGAYEGSRRKSGAPQPIDRSILHGIAGKEIRLLFRDRNFLVQTLIVPVLIVGFQVLMNPAILKGAAGDLRHASAVAFGMGAYVLIFSAFQILVVEGNSLWMLYTFPQHLDSILLRKTWLWCGFGLLYTLCILIGFGIASPRLQWTALSPAVTAVLGVIIYAYIASGIGVLATDPLQTEVQRKVRPDMMYLYMTLVAFFAFAIYSPSVWAKFAQIILSSLLAYALWQKVRDRTPYMLDPTQEPPPEISLSDGMIAVLAFFVVQGLMLMLQKSIKVELPNGAQLLIAFVTAGAAVWSVTMFAFWRQKVPYLLAAVGYRSHPWERCSWLRAIAAGLLGGVCAAGVCVAYQLAADHIEPLRALKEEALNLESGNDATLYRWIFGLAVFAAPIFEEYIFRGLVYRGLRRSVRPAIAIVASAGIFAIVHPPFSVIPVFGLGVAAACCFEYTHLLAAPIIAHMVYNYIVLALAN